MQILHTGLHLHLHVLVYKVGENITIMSNAFGLGDLDVVVKKITSGWIFIAVIFFLFYDRIYDDIGLQYVYEMSMQIVTLPVMFLCLPSS